MRVRLNRATILLAAAASVAVLGWTGAAGADARWSFGLAAGLTESGYIYRHITTDYSRYPEGFGATGSTIVSVARGIGQHFSITFTASRLVYRRPYLFAVPAFPGYLPLPSVRLNASFVPVTVGLRFDPITHPRVPFRPRVEVGPAVVLARWSEQRWNPSGSDAFIALAPGLTAALSEELRIGSRLSLTGTVRYLWSGPFGRHDLGQFSSGDFEGLKEALYYAGFEFRM